MISMEVFARQIKTSQTDDDIVAAIEQYNQALEKLIGDSRSLTQPPSRINLKGNPDYINDMKRKMTNSAQLFPATNARRTARAGVGGQAQP